MRRTVLVVDGSEAMAASGEYLPNKLLAMRSHLNAFVAQYFKQSPLSLLSTVVLRDGVAHRVTPLTNDPTETTRMLELRVFLQKPSGTLSIENGLRVALLELVSGGNQVDDVNSGDGGKSSLALQLNCRIVLLLGSVAVVDPGDVMTLVRLVAKANVMCDVLSLVGAPHIAAHLSAATGGQLFCPLNHTQLEDIVAELARRTPSSQRHRGAASGAAPAAVRVGFPELLPAHDDGHEQCDEAAVVCPRCHGSLRGVPETCGVCGLLVCSVPQIHTTMVASNDLLAGSAPKQAEELPPNVTCSLCGSLATGGAPQLYGCRGCGELRCAVCDAYLVSALRLCPTCLGATQRRHPS